MRFSPVFAFLVCASPVFSQGFHFGVKAGVPFTEYFETGYGCSSATRRYTVGASGEWQFSRSLGIEADAMYHRLGYAAATSHFNRANGDYDTTAINVNGGSWDFPLLAKYRFGESIRPYVAAGGVLRHVGPVHGQGVQTTGSLVTRTSTTTPLDTDDPSELRKRFYPGVTAAAGLEAHVGRIRVLPEFRYTRWTANIAESGGLIRFSPNQAEFLLGISF